MLLKPNWTKRKLFSKAPAAEEKAVGVKDQAGQHHRHEDGEDVHDHHDGLHDGVAVFGQVDHGPLTVQGVEGVEQADAEGEGEAGTPRSPGRTGARCAGPA